MPDALGMGMAHGAWHGAWRMTLASGDHPGT
jgi:hypothetical protein